MPETARLELDGKVYELPTFVGSEGERAIDIAKLRDVTGYITLDDGYGNTGSCRSAITYIDGDAGILRYRGIPIEDIAGRSSFVETAWLVIFGELPTVEQRDRFAGLLSESAMIDEVMRKHFHAFPQTAPPMAILSAMINTLSAHDHGVMDIHDDSDMERAAALLMSKVRTIAAASYKASIGEPLVYPRYDLKYAENFLHMM
ncbi:MAG: citrate (Si)-synthase, partial [Propionibacteriaceae bacterium]|nr:citrate (Si)-synthase [Propionibacteriaceae bacterium]